MGETAMTRHIAYFIENILRPFIQELEQLFSKCEHLKIDKEEIRFYLISFLNYGLVKTLIWAGVICLFLVLFFIGFFFAVFVCYFIPPMEFPEVYRVAD